VNRVLFELSRNRSFTFTDLFRFAVDFFLGFFIFAVEFTGATVLTLGNTSLQPFHWAAVVVFSGIAISIAYLRERVVATGKERKVIKGRLIFQLLSGLITQYKEYKGKSHAERVAYLAQVLRFAEKAVEAVLRESGYPVGEICSNVMVLSPSGDKLSLEYFGTFTSGREKITLPVDCKHPLPGAAAAVCQRKVIYIENTLAPEYGGHFREDKPYRSIVSIPIKENPRVEDSRIIGVLNIDSDIPSQFVSVDYIRKRILPSIEPFIMLLNLDDDLITATTQPIPVQGGGQ
jgi:hypothetical protein